MRKKSDGLKRLEQLKRLNKIVINKLEGLKKQWVKMNEMGEKLYEDGLIMIDDGDIKFNAFHCQEDIEIDIELLNEIKVAIDDSVESIKSIGGKE